MESLINLKKELDAIVLLWLATANSEGVPNVSPKELFILNHSGDLVIANIASPKSLMNILENPQVCISGINIWKQKGIQYKGTAKIISPQEQQFKTIEKEFIPLNQGRFRIQHFFQIKIQQTKKITAPSYFYYPSTTEEEQIQFAKKRYFANDLRTEKN